MNRADVDARYARKSGKQVDAELRGHGEYGWECQFLSIKANSPTDDAGRCGRMPLRRRKRSVKNLKLSGGRPSRS